MDLLGRFGVPDLRAKKRLEFAKKSGHLTYMYIWRYMGIYGDIWGYIYNYIYIYVYVYIYVYIYMWGYTYIEMKI